jgi:hypothetical protein
VERAPDNTLAVVNDERVFAVVGPDADREADEDGREPGLLAAGGLGPDLQLLAAVLFCA